MVETRKSWFGRLSPCAAVSLVALSGCGLVPKSRLDECHRVTQTLRAENGRLKDVALNLRSQNQDLSQRAVDDARQIAAKDEANEQLIKSVQAYQTDRDRLAEAYQTLERQVQLAIGTHPATAQETASSLRAVVATHPAWSFDESALTLSAASARLFEPGTATLKAEAMASLKALARVMAATPRAEGLALEVVAPEPAAPVVAAAFDLETTTDADLAAASARFLAAARGARVRDRLIAETGLDPTRVHLAPPPPPTDTSAPRRDSEERRVEIRLATTTAEPRP